MNTSGGPHAELTFEQEPTPVLAHDPLCDHETEASSTWASGVVRLLHFLELLCRHAVSGVDHAELERFGIMTDVERQTPPLGHGMQSILGQVQQSLLQLVGVDVSREFWTADRQLHIGT